MRKALLFCGMLTAMMAQAASVVTRMIPESGARGVNPDTHLTLVLSEDVRIGQTGFISIYDKQTGELVDRLDMSIPAGPTQGQPNNPAAQYTPVPYVYQSKKITNRNTKPGTPSGVNAWDHSRYQLDIIGGFSDAFHFYPIIAHGNQATIFLHHNMLDYGHEYYVTVDKGVIEGFDGIKGKKAWTFRTKDVASAPTQRRLVVAADGSGDFSTVQGAMDFIPDSLASEAERYEVYIKNGDYEELVYFRNKRFVTIKGESREGVLIHYPNNEVFNPHPADIKTNEVKGTFPSRRAAFAADNCSDLIMKDITLKTDCKGQAEGLLVNGERNFFENVHIIGDGDALQANGSCYWLNCRIDGGGDTILGRGPSFFNHCTITSYGAFMWIRNTEENHGNIFVDCQLKGLSKYAVLGRLPNNKGKNYPHAECVLLNCELDSIPAEGWGEVAPEASTATLLEFNSHTPEGQAIDISKRHSLLRQLNPLRDAELIGRYHDSGWVLNWQDEKRRIGDQILLYQRVTGGWPKNISMTRPLTAEERNQVLADKQRCDDSTIDNGATTEQIVFLARLYQQTKDQCYRDAFRRGVDYLLGGQYENGGWPQFWPEMRDYQKHITYNDDAMVNTMTLFRDMVQQKEPYQGDLTDEALRQRMKTAFDKGIECILATQIVTDGELTVWCQQYDRETLKPAKARTYELPSYCSQESAAITMLLMQLPSPDNRVKRAVHAAMRWFEKHKITGYKVVRTGTRGSSDYDTRLEEDPNAQPIWARFYDLENCEPFVCDRDGIPRRHLSEIGSERRNGYSWYNSRPAKLFLVYEKWTSIH